ncbi:hypothetical protein C8D88_12087 [Lentzea atacamensis]|uniref:Uncharacterized protein n=1 Tax=Lentzea atacamensis TaxID=531938 RepID=A0A316I0X5_9PSEU|nr:hypothetical protein [Lentzea atacamensis]PWK81037.1 hypothetical protein C8D88_12087 [Lentzea atacamensis]
MPPRWIPSWHCIPNCVVPASRVKVVDPAAATDAALARAEAGLDLQAGVLMQAVWLDAGPDRSGRMVLVLHDIVADRMPRILPWLVQAWTQPALVS